MLCVSASGLPGWIGVTVLVCLAGSVSRAVDPEPIVVFPAEINLMPKGQQQVVVRQRLSTGLTVDRTREAVYVSSDPAVAVVEQGVVRARGTGLAKLRVEVAEQVVNVDLFVGTKMGDSRLSFVRDVLPVLGRAGCAAGDCHAKPKGQNGFSLSVFSFDPVADYREVVKDERGRRVFPAFPAESLLLKKPTLRVEHEGGRRLESGSLFYQIIHDWIAQGMLYRLPDEPALKSITVFPREQRYTKSATQQLVVTARFTDRTVRDVTHLSAFSSSNKEIAEVNPDGLVRTGMLSGEGVVVVRYMGEVAQARITVPSDSRYNDGVYAALPHNNFIDDLAYSRFQKLGLLPSDRCSDSEFIRRAFIDAIGLLPEPSEVRRFLANPSPGKRAKLIDRLLDDPAYADTWANRWGDLFRPNIARVGLKSAYTIDNWIRECFATNKPYDKMVREILTAKGSTHRVGPTVIYRTRREPATLTTLFSQAFLGVRMDCARCHHHPNERWSQQDFYQFAAFFAETKRKGTGISPPISAGTQYIYHAPGGTVRHPVSNEVMQPAPLAGEPLATASGVDPRETLADWMLKPDNPFFARAMVNRVWGQFFGRGIVHPVDDFRATNPATNPPLLDTLAADFAKKGFDLKHLMRRIMNSHLYQISSIPNKTNVRDTRSFSRFYRRILSAENLHDIIVQVTGSGSRYNNLRGDARAVELWTTIMDSPLLDSFGLPNPSRNCPVERDARPSMVQALHLMNSDSLQAKLEDKSGRAARLVQLNIASGEIVDDLYLMAYSRWPSAEEKAMAMAAFAVEGAKRQQVVEDIMWVLINSAEFVFNH